MPPRQAGRPAGFILSTLFFKQWGEWQPIHPAYGDVDPIVRFEDPAEVNTIDYADELCLERSGSTPKGFIVSSGVPAPRPDPRGRLNGAPAARPAAHGMNILALDLATRCGWALIELGRIESGVQLFDVKRGESPGMRYLRFNRWLLELGARADLLVYEQTISRGHLSQAPQEIANGFATRIQEYCATRGIEHATVYPSTLKKWTTGKGNSDKAAMLATVQRRWKATVTDDNEAVPTAPAWLQRAGLGRTS